MGRVFMVAGLTLSVGCIDFGEAILRQHRVYRGRARRAVMALSSRGAVYTKRVYTASGMSMGVD